jgi:hypothetical protein
MTKTPLDIDAVVKAVTRPNERSTLFRWLYEHHDELVEAVKGKRIIWRAFCALFADAGLVNGNGRTPTERTARETWYRVRREVARQAAIRDTVQTMRSIPAMPSQTPASWQPPVVAPSPAFPSVPQCEIVTYIMPRVASAT